MPPTSSTPAPPRFDDIRLLRIHYLRGPNIWTYRPVLEVWLDLGALEDFPSDRVPGFADRLTALLPALIEHHCGVGERGGFIQRLREGTWAGHVLEHVVIELLNLAGMPTGFGQTRSTSRHGQYRMVFRARDEQVAGTALAEAHRLLMAALNDDPCNRYEEADVRRAVEAIAAQVDACYLGPSTAAIVHAAADRGIPAIRLNGGNLVQLGYGARQQRIWTAESDGTSAIGESIASDKALTKSLLARCGVPVPEGQLVASAEAAWEAAQDIGLPVAVKPSNANHGRGVGLQLATRDEVMAAFAVAEPEGREVLVERFVPGHEHRLLVVGGQVVAAARGEVVSVTGDGAASVRQLIERQLNSDPRRGAEESYPLDVIVPDTDPKLQLELQRQGLHADAVPAAGHDVIIQRNGNLGVDCTDQVHPEVAHAATLAARIVGLDIAGVDLVCERIDQPLAAQHGAIVEVNAGPGLLMHLKPAVGAPRPVGRAICDHLFPEDDATLPGRIPIVGVAGSQDTAALARLVAWLIGLTGQPVGLACRDGLFLDRRRVDARDSASWDAGRRLLVNRQVEAAVIENGAETILADGLPYDRCEIGIVTDLGGADALGHYDIRESEQMVKVLRTQVDVVLPHGTAVLNAADARVAGLAPLCDGAVLLYASDPDAAAAALAPHLAAGGQAVLVRQGRVVLATGASEAALPGMGPLAAWHAAHSSVSVDSLLAAVGAAWALGIALNLIGAGVEMFDITH